jgi:hypothetical protein
VPYCPHDCLEMKEVDGGGLAEKAEASEVAA